MQNGTDREASAGVESTFEVADTLQLHPPASPHPQAELSTGAVAAGSSSNRGDIRGQQVHQTAIARRYTPVALSEIVDEVSRIGGVLSRALRLPPAAIRREHISPVRE